MHSSSSAEKGLPGKARRICVSLGSFSSRQCCHCIPITKAISRTGLQLPAPQEPHGLLQNEDYRLCAARETRASGRQFSTQPIFGQAAQLFRRWNILLPPGGASGARAGQWCTPWPAGGRPCAGGLALGPRRRANAAGRAAGSGAAALDPDRAGRGPHSRGPSCRGGRYFRDPGGGAPPDRCWPRRAGRMRGAARRGLLITIHYCTLLIINELFIFIQCS